ncbi:MAG: hypothetical protein WBE20_11145 [Candidatus Acidiferrales bacterium]
MGLPPDAKRYFAEKHLEEAYKHLGAVEENLSKDAQEDKRAFEKFYYNLALFSGGTIALSITYLGYLKTLGRPLSHQHLLPTAWIALFVSLLSSLVYNFTNLYYSHHFRQRELFEAKKRKFQTEIDEISNMEVVNIRTVEELAAYQDPRREAVRACEDHAKQHGRKEHRYISIWRWAGRIAWLGFACGIGMLLAFAISNTWIAGKFCEIQE